MDKHKYPNGMHIYIIEDNKKYKIGYTDNLNKRLIVYNTGRANKAQYAYYKKTKCGKEIESCLKALLNKYLYRRKSEYYKCNIDIIINTITKCLKIEKNCIKCNDIILNQNGGNYNIIEKLIEFYKNKYNNYFNLYMNSKII